MNFRPSHMLIFKLPYKRELNSSKRGIHQDLEYSFNLIPFRKIPSRMRLTAKTLLIKRTYPFFHTNSTPRKPSLFTTEREKERCSYLLPNLKHLLCLDSAMLSAGPRRDLVSLVKESFSIAFTNLRKCLMYSGKVSRLQ